MTDQLSSPERFVRGRLHILLENDGSCGSGACLFMKIVVVYEEGVVDQVLAMEKERIRHSGPTNAEKNAIRDSTDIYQALSDESGHPK